MSLDVYLTDDGSAHKESGSGIFERENGQTKEISREEWAAKFPGREPVVSSVDNGGEVFSANITHNLNTMAREAEIYMHLWRPEEIGITKAGQLNAPLRAGLALMKSDPKRFEKLNPKNGWGSYADFVPWLERYIAACEANPNATVTASR